MAFVKAFSNFDKFTRFSCEKGPRQFRFLFGNIFSYDAIPFMCLFCLFFAFIALLVKLQKTYMYILEYSGKSITHF